MFPLAARTSSLVPQRPPQYDIAAPERALEQLHRQRAFYEPLQRTAQRSRTELRIPALLRQP